MDHNSELIDKTKTLLAGDVPIVIYNELAKRIGLGDEKTIEKDERMQKKIKCIDPEHRITGFAGAIGLHEFMGRTAKRSIFYLWDFTPNEWDAYSCIFEVSGGPLYTGGWCSIGGNRIRERVSLKTESSYGVFSESKSLKLIAFIFYLASQLTECPYYERREYYEDDFLKDMVNGLR